MGRWTEVSGQRVWSQRPPRGMVALIDHEGRSIAVAEELFEDAPQMIRHWLKEEPYDDEG
jgi:hypothetical protein